MQPFFFGSSRQPLFGVLHTPRLGTQRNWGVVICHPWGREYVVSHRTLRGLAVRLTQDGFHVLRFDFFGCGDSAGDDESVSISQWKSDLKTAIEELKDNTGIKNIVLVGLRMGATLCCLVGEETDEADCIVAWEPIVDGRRYVDEIHTAHAEWERDEIPVRVTKTDVDEILGFAFPETLQRELRQVHLGDMEQSPANWVFAVQNESDSIPDTFTDRLLQLGAQFETKLVEVPKIWQKREMNKSHVPLEVLQTIQSWLGERFR